MAMNQSDAQEGLAELCNNMFHMLKDLSNGWPFKELNHTLDEVRQRALALGVDLGEDDQDEED